ncbi:MAG: hypothetical protein LBS48_02295 [Treponema sp.]|nr:hypothetical protein [Treponema sp.]
MRAQKDAAMSLFMLSVFALAAGGKRSVPKSSPKPGQGSGGRLSMK